MRMSEVFGKVLADAPAWGASRICSPETEHLEAEYDGTFDSICPTCFQTIAQSTCEADLLNAEGGHVCNPSLVEHYREFSKAVSDYREERRDVSLGY